MTGIALTMMIVSLLIIWGGLIFALIRLQKKKNKVNIDRTLKKSRAC